jgi:hypothetical protein
MTAIGELDLQLLFSIGGAIDSDDDPAAQPQHRLATAPQRARH